MSMHMGDKYEDVRKRMGAFDFPACIATSGVHGDTPGLNCRYPGLIMME